MTLMSGQMKKTGLFDSNNIEISEGDMVSLSGNMTADNSMGELPNGWAFGNVCEQLGAKMTKQEAENLKTFQNYCTCGGYAWQMNDRRGCDPHMPWCPQKNEYDEWHKAKNT